MLPFFDPQRRTLLQQQASVVMAKKKDKNMWDMHFCLQQNLIPCVSTHFIILYYSDYAESNFQVVIKVELVRNECRLSSLSLNNLNDSEKN